MVFSDEKYKKMTVALLKKELNNRGLEEDGLKAVLIARLVADDAEGADEVEEEEVEAEPAGKRKTRAAASKAPAKSKAKKKSKSNKGKEEEEEEEEDDEEEAIAAESKPESHTKKAAEALRAAAEAEKKKGKAKGKPKPDELAPRGAEVFEDFDCMLNQTNIGQNNNKFYRIQLLSNGGSLSLWTHWGRVGERGQFANKVFYDRSSAISAFEKQFKSKTSNDWKKRDNFQAKSGKYTLIEMSYDDDEPAGGELIALPAEPSKPKRVRACTLPASVKDFVELIFSHDMFKQALQTMKIDTNKMPLGKISKSQIAKGYEILEEMLQVVNGGRGSTLAELSSRFYTAIPHSFGRTVPPVLNTQEKIKEKIDLLGVLGDIEIAQSLQKGNDNKQAGVEEIDHPADANYKLLDSDLVPLDHKKDKEEWDFITTYIENTQGSWRKAKILEVFKVNRHSEGPRFSSHDKIKHRKLLWHGTKMPVIVAILSGGLRIMPHSGGRVGAGLYFASEQAKSAGYVGTTNTNVGVMFLNEVALGNEKHITKDDCTLKAAPPGYDSVVAQGRTEPNPKDDITFDFEGKEVVIPVGKPINRPEYAQSSFAQTEYLVYKESQVRIRYLLKLQF